MTASSIRSEMAMRAAGIGLMLIVWEVLGQSGVLGNLWPPLSEIVNYAMEPSSSTILLRALQFVAASAGAGLLTSIGQ